MLRVSCLRSINGIADRACGQLLFCIPACVDPYQRSGVDCYRPSRFVCPNFCRSGPGRRFRPKSCRVPADRLSYRTPGRRSLFSVFFPNKNKAVPRGRSSRAARLHLWALSPLSYLSARTTNPVELRARRGRCRFGPPAPSTCSKHMGATPGKAFHGVYRHEVAQI
jgi:hypothetical protein